MGVSQRFSDEPQRGSDLGVAHQHSVKVVIYLPLNAV